MKINLKSNCYATNQTGVINIGMPTIFVPISNTNNNFTFSEDQLAEQIFNLAKTTFGINQGFYHPRTIQQIQICFTGDDPMNKQNVIADLTNALDKLDDINCFPVLIESNGNVPIEFPLKRFVYYSDHIFNFSCSIPLNKKKIQLDISTLENYADNSTAGCVQFVVDGSTWCWDKLDELTDSLYSIVEVNPNWSFWVKPKVELLHNAQLISDIIDETLLRGFNILTNRI